MSSVDDARSRYGALRSDEVAALDRAAGESGVAVMQLMELAGFQVARCAWRMLGEQPGHVAVVGGRGNNGGDAMVAARFLATWGCEVNVALVAEHGGAGPLLAAHIASAEASGVRVEGAINPHAVRAYISDAALILDGVLGTGLRAAPREPQAGAIREINASAAPTLSIDVPSGLDATSGEPYDPCVRAAATCTLAAVKAGLWTAAARAVAGEIWAADIGMPAAAWRAVGIPSPSDLRGGALLPVPSATLY